LEIAGNFNCHIKTGGLLMVAGGRVL